MSGRGDVAREQWRRHLSAVAIWVSSSGCNPQAQPPLEVTPQGHLGRSASTDGMPERFEEACFACSARGAQDEHADERCAADG